RIQKFSASGALLGKWGSSGGGDQQLRGPTGVAVDSIGNVYVADTGNDRVKKYSPQGGLLAQWGASGSGDGEFRSPNGVTLDPMGGVYVVDALNQRIQQFSNAGAFRAKWGTRGASSGQFDFTIPAGLAADALGNLYVADSGNHRVQRSRPPVSAPPGTVSQVVTLSASATSVTPGGTVIGDWSGIASPTAKDWIGLYRVGAPDYPKLAWIYVSCSSIPGTPRAAGSCPLGLPGTLTPGTYELRLFADDKYLRLATSNSFLVDPFALLTPTSTATTIVTPSSTAIPTMTATATPVASSSATPTDATTATPTPTGTATSTAMATATPTPTTTATDTAIPTATATATTTAAPSASPTGTPSPTTTPTILPSPTLVEGIVTRAVDGSSLDAHVNGIRVALGYVGVDTPPPNQRC